MELTFDSWATSQLANGYAPATVRVRRAATARAAVHAGVAPENLLPEHMTAWLAEPFAPATRRAYLAHLTAWGEWIGRPDLTTAIRRVALPKRQPDPLPEAELVRLLDQVRQDPRLTCWVLLGAFAGFRASETARIAGEDLRGDSVRVLGKGGRIDVLPIPPVLAEALQSFAAAGPLWPSMTGRQVSARVAWQARKAGVLQFRYHRLRHRFGTAVYRVDRDLLLTQRLMRHESPETTAGYALCDDTERTTVNQLPGAGSITKE